MSRYVSVYTGRYEAADAPSAYVGGSMASNYCALPIWLHAAIDHVSCLGVGQWHSRATHTAHENNPAASSAPASRGRRLSLSKHASTWPTNRPRHPVLVGVAGHHENLAFQAPQEMKRQCGWSSPMLSMSGSCRRQSRSPRSRFLFSCLIFRNSTVHITPQRHIMPRLTP